MAGIGETSREQAWRAVGAELRRLRTERGLSLAGLARRVHYSKGYLSKLETGDKRISPDVARRCDEALSTGGALAAMLLELSSGEPAEQLEPASEDSPYRGLASFAPEHARWFFGRERATADLVAQLGERLEGGGAALAVVAPSGTGKSSLLAAGLIPALARGALPGSRHWTLVRTTPTSRPLAALATEVAAATGTDPRQVRAALSDPGQFIALLAGLVDAASRETRETGTSDRVVLIVDQFEETFTECQDEAERRAFIEVLCAAASTPSALVVLGLRADFYGRCLAYPALLASLQQGQLPLGSLSAEQLREAITGPADTEGLSLEPGLVEVLLTDLGVLDGADGAAAGSEPGALPLLSHALLVTWQQREGRVLTVAGYRRAGGIRQAIATTAERAYSRLTPAEQQIARQVFLRLIHVGEQAEETRRRLPHQRLVAALPATTEQAQTVLETFARARLLTFDANHVQITHEALLRVWPRLRDWITADRAGLRIHQQLTQAAQEWQTLHQDPGALYRGTRLAVAREWADRDEHRSELDSLEQQFLDASAARETTEHATAQRRTRHLRQLVAALTVLLILTVAVGGVALYQRQMAVSRHLAAEATALRALQPAASALLSAEAFRIEPTVEARSALLSTFPHLANHVVLNGHTHVVNGVAFSPDGRLLASAGGKDDGIILWDATRHRRLASLVGHTQAVHQVAFSPDGRLLASASRDTTIMLWDVARRARIATLTSHTAGVTAVAFSPDGHTLASASDDRTIMLWDVASHSRLATLADHAARVPAVAFSPDGHTLASASDDRTIMLWNVASRIRIATLTGHTDAVTEVAFSPDERTLASASADNQVMLWDVASRTRIATLTSHTARVTAVAFSPDGHTLASASNDRTIMLWDVASHSRLATLTGHNNYVSGVAFSPDGRTLASSSGDRTVIMWNPILPPFSGHTAAVTALALNPDGHTLASASADPTVIVWDMASGTQTATLTGHTAAVTALALNPDGHTLASASNDRTVIVWDMASGTQTATLTGHTDAVTAVAFSPDGKTLATGSTDHTVRLWNITDMTHPTPLGQPLIGQSAAVTSVAFNPDGHQLASTSQDRSVMVWDMASRSPTARLPVQSDVPGTAAFSPDGQTLAIPTARQTIVLWDLAHQARIATLQAHEDTVAVLAYSPDGHTLASGDFNGAITWWDIASQEPVATLTGHTARITSLIFGPDRHTLLSASEDHTIVVWNTDTQQVQTRICTVIGHNLTYDQWSQFAPGTSYHKTCD